MNIALLTISYVKSFSPCWSISSQFAHFSNSYFSRYNKFAEDCEKPENLKEASDSSCSEDNDDCEGWCKNNLD